MMRIPTMKNTRRKRDKRRPMPIITTMSILAVLGACSSSLVVALSFRWQGAGGGIGNERIDSSRYFTSKLVAPPLHRHGSQQRYESRPLDIVYTNDPRTVSLWISDHLTSSEWTTIGFDMEILSSLFPATIECSNGSGRSMKQVQLTSCAPLRSSSDNDQSVPRGAPWISRNRINFMGPATVQLSTLESSIVVHLAKKNGKLSLACTPMLEAVLRDPSIVKAGCQIDDDLLELRNLRIPNLEATNRLDLCGLGGREMVPGLKRLTATILGLDLPKHKKLSASDWSQVPLIEKQIVYAARDAWAAAAIVDHLAYLDEALFGPGALAQELQSFELSLGDVCRKQKNRRQAKALLSALLPRSPQGSTEYTELPPWKAAVVQELRYILQENRRERPVQYHIPALATRYNHTS